jgi:polygalacturonase
MGYVTNITFRNLVMNGNAACKIKTWPNTTGEISNILCAKFSLQVTRN